MTGWPVARGIQERRWAQQRGAMRRVPELLESRWLLTSGYLALPLVSDQSAAALIQDTNLVNPWGGAIDSTGGNFFVTNNGSGVATQYAGAVGGTAFEDNSLVIGIPGGSPTGTVGNGTSDFTVHAGASSGPASYLFASSGGEITGWNQGVPPPSPSNQAQLGAATNGAIYTGLALGNNGGQNFLYAADFHDNRIDVFSSTFQSVSSPGGFSDPNLPGDMAPYNIVNIGGELYVSYAVQDAFKQNPVDGSGNGFVDVFNLNGALQRELIVNQPGSGGLNVPWGMVVAPANFGDFSNDLLVANNGDGMIRAYNSQTGAFVGTLSLPSGQPLTIDGLRGLVFGNGSTVGNANELFFSAGSAGGQHGLVGAIVSAQGVNITAQGGAVQATIGVSLDATLAVFADAQGFFSGGFTATVNWGDGTTSMGTVSALPAGGFAVNGSHTYASIGQKNVSVQIKDAANNVGTASGVVEVSSPGLSITGLTVTPTEGQAFSGPAATFTDSDGNTSRAAYTATIMWGDGATTAGTIAFAGGTFSVLGVHTFAEEGTKSVTITVHDDDGASGSGTATAKIADAPLSGTQVAYTATMGQPFTGTVATFSDANADATTGDFMATIAWGDGTVSAGTVSAGPGGTFSVVGSHTYAHAGSVNATITVKDVGGAQAVVHDTTSVSDPDGLAATLLHISATEGTLFMGTVATVADTDLATLASGLAATINWGDGSTSTGTIAGVAGVFLVADSHTYIDEGRYTLTITVTHVGGSATTTAENTITVADRGSLSLTGVAFTATVGETFSGEVATATDTYAAPEAGFAATIAWGDGTRSAATVSGPNGHFTIDGTHLYKHLGNYSPVVKLGDLPPGTISATATLSAQVVDAPITATAVTFNSTEGQTFSALVATFTDANSQVTAADFTATINWGDGHTTAGMVSGTSNFTVSGSHSYALGGTYSAVVKIADPLDTTAAADSTAIIADYPLTAAGVSISGGEGKLFFGTVATFADTNPSGGKLADYTANIHWGDGTSSRGTVSGSPGHFKVSGKHTFADVSDAVVVVINDIGGASVTTTSAATVTDANTLTAVGTTTQSATEGKTFSGTLATFTDSFSGNPASDFSASVVWGDGQTTTAVVSGSKGSFAVSGVHVYAEAGTYTAQVALSHNLPGTAKATASATLDVADAPLTPQGTSFSATEGGAFVASVGSFTDANQLSTAADFTATINWGDGTSSAGTVSQTAAGSFVVLGSHVYSEEAKSLAVTVLVHDLEGSQATVASTANIADAQLTATGVAIAATEGLNSTLTVATFTDANPLASAADFTATINWGDGSSSTAGTVSADPQGGFDVTGKHAYVNAGSRLTATVVVSDDGGSSGTALSMADVVDAPLTPKSNTFTATEGVSFAGTVAAFNDANPFATAAAFTATIAWGDGGPATAGTVQAAAGEFVVTGAHTYADEAARPVTVVINDSGGSSTTATATALVDDAALSSGAGLTIHTTEGTVFSGTVGTFSDANTGATKSDFTATIDWGDGGATSLGTIISAPGGVFVVSGSHSYAEPAAAMPIKIAVNDIGGSTTTVLGSARVSSTHFVAAGTTISAVQDTVFSGIVATCNDSSTNPRDYSALIAWGDGTTTVGVISAVGDGGFFISGSHSFSQAGTNNFTVVVTDVALDQLTVSSRANVADAPLAPRTVTIAASEGATFSGTVASFTDADPTGNVVQYSASINWGDGQSSAGTITASPQGGFVVLGSHLYTEQTQGLTVTVVISDSGGSHATALSTANIADPPLTLSPLNVTVPAGGLVSNAALAILADPGGNLPPADYSVTIDWGDGSTTTIGTVVQSGSTLDVVGSHSYSLPGNYQVAVDVSDQQHQSAQTAANATVAPTANQLFIEAAYLDVLDRAVDPSSLLYWTQQLSAGQPRTSLADSIDHSAEYFGQIIIAPAYLRYLNRPADAAGLTYWTNQMQNDGLTDERLEAGFIGSDEFYERSGGTDKSWVDAMYQDLLGRTADSAGETFWTAQLAAGTSRADVAYGFAASPERESQRISDDYMHYLGRAPDQAGLDFWLAEFAAGMTNESLITGFVGSDEYFKVKAGG